MTRYLSLLCFVLLSISSFAQMVTGVVVDAETGQGVPYAGISINDEARGVKADMDGHFSFPAANDIQYLRVRAFGFSTKKVNYNGEVQLRIELNSSENVIADVDVYAGDNPLHRIIRNVIANRSENNPTSLDAFSYESYSHFELTLRADTIGTGIDTFYVPADTTLADSLQTDSIMKIDSSGFFMRKFASEQHLFLMESATERKFAGGRDNETVLATRISGLKTPMFVLLANELQSFSFYDNYISMLGSERVNPVAPGAIGRYVYLPLDTILSGTDTVFAIQFFPVPGHKFKGMDGELYITTDNWAVTRVVARPTGQDILGIDFGDGTTFGIEIGQVYEKVSGAWFPSDLSMDFRRFQEEDYGTSSVIIGAEGGELYGLGTTTIKNIQINPELERKDIHRIAVEIEPLAADRPEEFWYQYRGDSLTQKERRTYEVLDSIGEDLSIDEGLKWIMALSTGKFRLPYVDVNIDKLMRYNVYEGFRLGLGLQTNPYLSEHFSIGGNVAYGFKDKVWKYGYCGEVYLHKATETTLFGGYEFDIYETGGTHFNLQRKTIFGDANYRFLFVPTFNEVSDAFVGIKHRIWPNWNAELSYHRKNIYTMSDYEYLYEQDGGDLWINGFNVNVVRLEMEYAPNDRYMLGPFGLRPLEITYPRFRLAYEESLDNGFDRNFPYRRIDGYVQHQVKRVYTGITTFTLTGSWIQGDVPYPLLAGPEANKTGTTPFDYSSSVASMRSFETMPFNTFAANRYAAVDIRHSFENRLFSIGTWAPSVDIMYRGTIGTLDHPEKHIGFELSSLDHIYHEAGVEVNEILNGIGLGFYQRFGAYYTGTYSDNIAIKLTYRYSLF